MVEASHTRIKGYRDKWRRTLGPNSEKSHPRGDTSVVIGSLNILECPTYVVAPLRGDVYAATDSIMWANTLLQTDANAHVVFMGPHTDGGSREDGIMIEKMLEALLSTYPGHAMCVGCHTMVAGSLDGLVLYAMPHTSKQIVLGYIPEPDDEIDTSVRNLDCLEVETVRIPSEAKGRQHTGARMMTIHFNKATSLYNRDKQPRPQVIRESHTWKAPPGWVTQISFNKRESRQTGGNPVSLKEVILNNQIYKIRDPAQAMGDWKKGIFNSTEQVLLEENNLKFTNEVYALFLKGLVDSECTSEPDTHLSPECAVFRYLMLKAHLDGEYDKKVSAVVPSRPSATVEPSAPPASAASSAPPAPSAPPEPSAPVEATGTSEVTAVPSPSAAISPAPSSPEPIVVEDDGLPQTEEEKKTIEARLTRAKEGAKEAKAIASTGEPETEEEKKLVEARLARAKESPKKNNTRKKNVSTGNKRVAAAKGT